MTHFRCRLRLRSFLLRLCPVHRILKALAERPTASSNPSEPRRRTWFNPHCSRLSIADSTTECFLRLALLLGGRQAVEGSSWVIKQENIIVLQELKRECLSINALTRRTA